MTFAGEILARALAQNSPVNTLDFPFEILSDFEDTQGTIWPVRSQLECYFSDCLGAGFAPGFAGNRRTLKSMEETQSSPANSATASSIEELRNLS